MKAFTGICRGGPYDGKQLLHTRKDYRVVLVPPLSWKAIDKPPDEIVPMKFGIYHHVAEQWIWREEKGRPAEWAA